MAAAAATAAAVAAWPSRSRSRGSLRAPAAQFLKSRHVLPWHSGESEAASEPEMWELEGIMMSAPRPGGKVNEGLGGK